MRRTRNSAPKPSSSIAMVATVIGGVISLSLGQQGPPRLNGLVRERYCLITKVSITPSCVGVGFHESGCTDLPERVQSQAYPGSHRTQCCLVMGADRKSTRLNSSHRCIS